MIYRFAAAAFLTLCLAVIGLQAPSRAQFNGCSAGFCSQVASAAYSGPGNIVTGAAAWWGLRCYNSAYAGNVADVWDSATGSITETLITCSSGGIINTGSPTALATTCASGCVVKTLYDQSGALSCGGAACDLTQATNSKRPAYIASTFGGKPGLNFVGANAQVLANATGFSFSEPFTVSIVLETNGDFTGFQRYMTAATNGCGVSHSTTATLQSLCTNLTSTAAASDSALHAVQFIQDNAGAKGAFNVDNTITALTSNVSNVPSGGLGYGGASGNFQYVTGYVQEAGWWTSSFSVTQQTNMCHNQFLYWGTVTSC